MDQDKFKMLTERIQEFSRMRDWDQFHSPKNLAMAITGEAGELAAEFQWLTASESEFKSLSEEQLNAIRLEIADIQIYLLRLADKLAIDVPQAVLDKLEINEARFKI
jgi:NTP pyrophosphatase (non-canonical NTP hydrolase)